MITVQPGESLRRSSLREHGIARPLTILGLSLMALMIMWITTDLVVFLAISALLILLSLFLKSEPINQIDSYMVMEYPLGLGLFLLLFCLVFLPMVILNDLQGSFDTSIRTSGIVQGFILLIESAGILLAIEYHFTWYFIDCQRIVKISIFGKTSIQLNEVDAIVSGAWGLAIVAGPKRIRGVTSLLKNYSEFAATVKNRIDESKWTGVKKEIETWAARSVSSDSIGSKRIV